MNVRLLAKLSLTGSVFLGSFGAVYLKFSSTAIAYDLGSLKAYELELLEKKGQLTAKLAKITTKTNLERLASSEISGTATPETLAALGKQQLHAEKIR